MVRFQKVSISAISALPGFLQIKSKSSRPVDILTWKNIDDLLSANPAIVSTLKLKHPDGSPFWEKFGEDIWDPTIENGILYGGVMSLRGNRIHAHEDHDGWSRRVYAFKNVNAFWVREKLPLSGPLPESPTWLGHTYGQHFIDGYMFYEKVTYTPYLTADKKDLKDFGKGVEKKSEHDLGGGTSSVLRGSWEAMGTLSWNKRCWSANIRAAECVAESGHDSELS